jgi:hypothetical protein
MGYDLYSEVSDIKLAEEFAKKNGYTYLFDPETGGYDGDAKLYFRANIWGMSSIRRFIDQMYTKLASDSGEFNALPLGITDKMVYNDGELVTKDDILELFGLLAVVRDYEVDLNKQLANHGEAFDAIIQESMPLIEKFADEVYSTRVDELSVDANGQPVVSPRKEQIESQAEEYKRYTVELIKEFLEYNAVCFKLDGYRVF